MTKYRLKRGLLCFQAGDAFEFDDEHQCVSFKNTGIEYGVEFLEITRFYRGADGSGTREHFDEFFEEVREPWEPKDHEGYYCIDDHGGVKFDPHNDVIRIIDRERIDIGNVFKSEEEAEEAIEWLKARATLMHDTKGFRVVPGKSRYQIIHSYEDYEHLFVHGTDLDYLDANDFIAFENMLDAEESIKKHKAEWLTYLRVKKGE